MSDKDEKFSPEETEQRFRKALTAAMKMPHKPHKPAKTKRAPSRPKAASATPRKHG